ncbi:MAG: YciI family protein [Bacteroidota bacterium]
MKEFILLFRMDILTPEAQPSAEQMQSYMNMWMKWIGEIAMQKRLADGGNHMVPSGRVIRPGNNISRQPYSVNNESVAGYIIVLAKDLDEATTIAEKCPILQGEGTSVEVRETAIPGS